MNIWATKSNNDAFYIKSDVGVTDSFNIDIGPRKTCGILVAKLVASNDERYRVYGFSIRGDGAVALTEIHSQAYFDANFTLTGGTDQVSVSVSNSTSPGVFTLETWSI